MQIRQIDKYRNHIFVLFVSLFVLGLVILGFAAKQQNHSVIQSHLAFQEGIQLVNAGEYSQAIKRFSTLPPDFRNTFPVSYYTAFSYASIKDYENACIYMEKAEQSNPAFWQDPFFLYEYGQNLYYSGHYEKARLYLMQSLAINDNTKNIELKKQIVELLKKTETKL